MDFPARKVTPVQAPPASLETALGDEGYDCVSRNFAPAKGIDEDPVTGGAHCAPATQVVRINRYLDLVHRPRDSGREAQLNEIGARRSCQVSETKQQLLRGWSYALVLCVFVPSRRDTRFARFGGRDPTGCDGRRDEISQGARR
jgi:hypothetical protein